MKIKVGVSPGQRTGWRLQGENPLCKWTRGVGSGERLANPAVILQRLGPLNRARSCEATYRAPCR